MLNALVISFHFEKAFDKVEWSILDEVLQYFNFGPNIRKYIKILQTDMQTTVLSNGFIDEWFTISRSLRQGDPISSFLYIIMIEVLGIKLRANKNILRIGPGADPKLHSVPHNSNSLISNYRLFRGPPSAPKITPLTQC